MFLAKTVVWNFVQRVFQNQIQNLIQQKLDDDRGGRGGHAQPPR